jgi:hypothetical protein
VLLSRAKPSSGQFIGEPGQSRRAALFLVLAAWLLGSAKFVRLQRQKPAMFAQMPLFVYRHFTGAACTTSSDGRFALFSVPSTPAFLLASGLSNSSDMVRSPDISEPSTVQSTQFKTFCRTLRLQS